MHTSSECFLHEYHHQLDVDAVMTGRDAMELTRVKQELEKAAEETQKSTLLEYDWQKIKDIEFQEMLRNKVAHMKRLRTDFQCTKCPDLNEHVSIPIPSFATY